MASTRKVRMRLTLALESVLRGLIPRPAAQAGRRPAATAPCEALEPRVLLSSGPYVSAVAINGNLPALAGPQRSMVESVEYTFDQPVTLAASGAFGIAIAAGETGTIPTLAWSALNPDASGGSAQWLVIFGGPGVVAGSIANGVYDIQLNRYAVTGEADPSLPAQPHNTDIFFRLFGDYYGIGVATKGDHAKLIAAETTYDPVFDYNGDGVVDNSDDMQFGNGFFYDSGVIDFNPAALRPTSVAATALGPTSVAISWTAPSDPMVSGWGAAVSGYSVQRWSAADGTLTTIATGLPATATSFTDATALPGNDYQYQVAAQLSGLSSDWSLPSNDAITQTLAPGSVVALGTDQSSVTLAWDAAAGALSYNIYRKGPTDSSFVQLGSVGAASTGYTDAAADSDTPYSYQVTAVDQTGESAPSNAVTARTLYDTTAGYDTLWSYNQAPQNPSVLDSSAGSGVELGAQFSSDVGGYLSGIQFFKAAQDSGTHTGELWDASGDLLATATFTDESQSGWQQVDFSSPVLIAGGTPYTVSYHTTSSYYPNDGSYFSSEYNSTPLHVAPNVNGVYAYGASAFPRHRGRQR